MSKPSCGHSFCKHTASTARSPCVPSTSIDRGALVYVFQLRRYFVLTYRKSRGSRCVAASQECPKGRSNLASERPWRPNGAHLVPKSPLEAFRKPFWTPRGTIFHPPGVDFRISFHPPESICKTVLGAKLMQAYGQHRSTSLCNFCMLISTATDSRSIDR